MFERRMSKAMKKSKKFIVFLAVCLLAVSLCACSTPAKDAPESPAPVSDPPSPTPAPTPTPTPTPEPVKQTKTGIVIEASMHTVTIEANDGSTYYFLVDDDTEVVGDGENLGDTASVEFEGDYIENVPATKIQVIKKADEDISAKGVEAQEPPAENGGTAPAPTTQPDTLKYITGVVKDAAMNNVTVEWNGKDYLILKDDKTSVEGDIVVGATVRVYHTGDIADGVVAVDISVMTPENTDNEVRYITGTVVDASMNSILIENDGHVYSVLKDENTKSDSIAVGDTVRVYHKGSYADGMTATSIVKM